jgi:hypothetical protein
MFDMMEQDADGEIKITEAVNFMHSSGYKDASVEEVAAKYDEDENGLINLHEFTEIYRDLQVQCLQTLSSAIRFALLFAAMHPLRNAAAVMQRVQRHCRLRLRQYDCITTLLLVVPADAKTAANHAAGEAEAGAARKRDIITLGWQPTNQRQK